MKISISDIQSFLAKSNLDGWLLFDFHGSNQIARDIVGVKGMVTRRWLCWVPKTGAPQIIRHAIESQPFAHLGGDQQTYSSWRELDAAIRAALGSAKQVAMEYSPNNAIPYIACVDAGTIEKLRSWGIEVVSSADLVAHFLARWSADQIAGHHRAAAALIAIKDKAYALIAERVHGGRTLTEYEVVEFIRNEFQDRGLVTDEGPICAVDAHAGNPHYEPTAGSSAPIGRGQLVLLDIWAKWNTEDAVYADITWTAFTGDTVSKKITDVFEIVRQARDRAVEFANERLAAGATLYAYEIDDACREVITRSGYGDRFIHRTGHSIGAAVHGIGPNIDNMETQDQRRLEDGMCFSIEPGIYLPEFGIRSEIDVLIETGRAVVTTLPLQTEITRLPV
jgi:Xaa-Pro aminopeptidase